MHKHMYIHTEKYPYGYVYTCMHTHKYTSESHAHVICVHTYVNMPVCYKLFLFPLPDLSRKQADMSGSSFHPMYVSYRMLEVWVSGLWKLSLASLLLYVLV